MLIEINAKGLERHAGGMEAIRSEVARKLDRFQSRLTRVEIHFEDVNADRGGNCDKRCLMELRPKGTAPIAVSDCAPEVGPSLAGASSKAVSALDSHFGKIDMRR